MTESLRPRSGARFVMERVGEGGAGEVVYRGLVHLPGADVPLEVRIGAAATARVDAAAIPQGGPAAAELERAAAALARAAVRSAVAGERPAPRKIVRWRG